MKNCLNFSFFRFLCVPMAVAAVSGLWGCGDEQPRDNYFEEAEAELARGNVTGAMRSADSVLSTADTASMGWKDYCRAFVIYSVAYDDNNLSADENHILDRSERCLSKAMSMNSDSTAVFLMGQPGERMSAVQSMMSILKRIEDSKKMSPDDFATDHDIDPDAPDSHSHEEGHEQ